MQQRSVTAYLPFSLDLTSLVFALFYNMKTNLIETNLNIKTGRGKGGLTTLETPWWAALPQGDYNF